MLAGLGDAVFCIESVTDFGVTGSRGDFITFPYRDKVGYEAGEPVFSFYYSCFHSGIPLFFNFHLISHVIRLLSFILFKFVYQILDFINPAVLHRESINKVKEVLYFQGNIIKSPLGAEEHFGSPIIQKNIGVLLARILECEEVMLLIEESEGENEDDDGFLEFVVFDTYLQGTEVDD